MMELLDLMQADLDQMRDLIFEVRTADENSFHESESFNALVTLVKSQTDARRRVFKTFAPPENSELSRAVADVEDRAQGADNLEKIIECCTNRSTWHASVAVYCELLEQVIQREMRDLLPALFDTYPVGQRKKLAVVYARVRGFIMPAGDRAVSRAGHPGEARLSMWQAIWRRVLSEAG